MGSTSIEGRRGYIDEFVAQTRTPSRPRRSEAQESHVADAEQLMSEKDGGDDARSIKTIRQRFPPNTPPPAGKAPPREKREEEGKLPTRYIPSLDFFGRVQQSFHENDSRTLLNPAEEARTPTAPRRPVSSVYSQPGGFRVASSIYSRATDDDGVDDGTAQRWNSQEEWFKGSVLEEEEFIDSYERDSKGSGEVKRDTRGFI